MITSLRNKRVARAVRLKKRALREKDRRFLVEGVQGVREALASGARVHEVFHGPSPDHRLQPVIGMARDAGITVLPASDDVMARLTSTVTPQGLVAVADFVDVLLDDLPDEARTVPILIEVRDPGNAGTIVRSADAAGADAVVFARSSVDIYNEKAVRATAGSLFHLPVVREVDPDEAVTRLRGAGFAVLATDTRGADSIHDVDFTAPTAILFGNEARGLPAEAMALADRSVRVPIVGRAESLNLAAATALVLFEGARQRAAAASRDADASGGALASIVAGSAHDIRSPLAAMLGFTSTMLSRWDRLDDTQRLAMVEGMAHDARRMRVLVAELVDAARLASGELRLRLAPVELLDVARSVQAELSAPDVQIEVSGEGSPIVADAERLHTVLSAMVEAAQWWGERGPVRLVVSGTRVEVERNGSSFDHSAAQSVFIPRGPGSGGGSKVGMFVGKGLAEAHGGILEAESRNGSVRLLLSLPESPVPTPDR